MVALLVVASVVVSTSSRAASCTDGTDCLCDTITGTILCEDFEAQTLHDDVGYGVTTGNYGPWYDHSGYGGNARGYNSHWRRNYGSGDAGCAWANGEPASPTLGNACAYGTCFQSEWATGDPWQGNTKACIDIVRDGEFNDEDAAVTTPTTVHDGAQSLGHRVAIARTAGIIGEKNFGAQTSIGVTMAMAYPSNSGSAGGLWTYPWKSNEWRTVSDGGRADGIVTFHNTSSLGSDDPFQHFMFLRNDGGLGWSAGTPQATTACNTALSGATVRRGAFSCVDTAMYYRADPTYYDRATDWPFGTWGCVQAQLSGLGTSNLAIKIWFNEVLIVDADTIDGTIFSSRGGYTGIVWNNYANRNQTGDPSTIVTYRYEDNVVVTNGAPKTCTEIGFNLGAVAPVANFTGTPLFGIVPLSVVMTDTSTNTPTSWAWDCDTTVPSTDYTAQNPTCVYSTPGTYTVSLTATNGGGSDAEVKTGYVTASAVASSGGGGGGGGGAFGAVPRAF